MKPLPTRFTLADAEAAEQEWGCNCGPAALAAILGLTLDEVRPAIPKFEERGYTSPRMMKTALDQVDAGGFRYRWNRMGGQKVMPDYGLVRVQWEGPWTRPGAHWTERLRHTHWIGCCLGSTGYGIFDVNCMNNGSGWASRENWESVIVPFLIRETAPAEASGSWHITHTVQIELGGMA